MNRKSLLAAYVRQQKELGMPDIVFGQAEKIKSLLFPRQGEKNAGRISAPYSGKAAEIHGQSKSPYTRSDARFAGLAPRASTVKEPEPSYSGAALSVQTAALTFKEKRAVFTKMYTARCGKCTLAKTRTKFVFGSGNVDAPLMIIGEAPGAEEDLQGLPFVGAAGQLLTELLAAIAIDRKKDVFITNILKCRPPDNRTPDAGEVAACLLLVQKQIEVIAPRLLLLLGRIAAHALLGTVDSIGKLRGRVHEYRGIPAVVTYHPAALLRTAEYRRPTEDDFRTAARLLKGDK
jgi:uracil-DNA glycosylase